jgi:hypothetical protein
MGIKQEHFWCRKRFCDQSLNLSKNFRAVRDFVLSPEINGKVHAMVSLHTHGQLFILPYNYHKQTYPEDYQELVKKFQIFLKKLNFLVRVSPTSE